MHLHLLAPWRTHILQLLVLILLSPTLTTTALRECRDLANVPWKCWPPLVQGIARKCSGHNLAFTSHPHPLMIDSSAESSGSDLGYFCPQDIRESLILEPSGPGFTRLHRGRTFVLRWNCSEAVASSWPLYDEDAFSISIRPLFQRTKARFEETPITAYLGRPWMFFVMRYRHPTTYRHRNGTSFTRLLYLVHPFGLCTRQFHLPVVDNAYGLGVLQSPRAHV